MLHPVALQEEALAALAAERALRLLPPLARCPGGPPAYLAAARSGGGGSGDSQTLPEVPRPLPRHVLEQLATLLADGELEGVTLEGAEHEEGGEAAAGATPVSAAAEAEPRLVADLARHHVMQWLLAPGGTGLPAYLPACLPKNSRTES